MGAPGSPARLVIGRVGRAHGLRGEVSVSFTSDRPERAQAGAVMYAGTRRLVVAGARPHQGRWLVRFDGVDDRSAAQRLQGEALEGDPLDVDEDGTLWAHQVIGLPVVDLEGHVLGVVVAVESNPAHDLLVLDGGGLVPTVFVRASDEDRVVVDPPAGLLEV